MQFPLFQILNRKISFLDFRQIQFFFSFFSVMNYGLLVHRHKHCEQLKCMQDEINPVLLFPLIYAHCTLA